MSDISTKGILVSVARDLPGPTDEARYSVTFTGLTAEDVEGFTRRFKRGFLKETWSHVLHAINRVVGEGMHSSARHLRGEYLQ